MQAVIFPGQGSQRVGMGADLFDEFPELINRSSEVLGYSLRDLCAEGPMARLTATNHAQPAIYVVNALAYRRWRQQAAAPDFLMGHSVAEYNALEASGAVDFETGLRLVAKRGEWMAQASGGGMAAVIGLDEAAVREVLASDEVGDVFAANFNTPDQIVVSGEKQAVLAAEAAFLAAGASRYVVLKVSAAFHSPFMGEARDQFGAFAAGVSFGGLAIPVISNVTARPHREERLRDCMVEQITSSVRWCESIRYLLAQGLEPDGFHEVGAGRGRVVKPMVVKTARLIGPLEPGLLRAEQAAEDVAATAPVPPPTKVLGPSATSLGSAGFQERFGVRLSILAGGMYRGIASTDLVVRMAGAGLLGFFGVGGLPLSEVEEAIADIQARVPAGAPYGVNFLANNTHPESEELLTDLLLRSQVKTIEASAFMEVTPALARYRAKGLRRRADGSVEIANRVMAKVSRPDVAVDFLRPAAPRVVAKLLEAGSITEEEAELLALVPVADALCVEADSGGHTDQGMPFALFPSILNLRDRLRQEAPGLPAVYVGAAGGIGTPEAAAAALVLGAEFLLMGSVNQCTVEAGTSDLVKDLLQEMDVQDTDYAPSGALFEMGATVQVLKKGLFFPARANKLVNLYRQHGSLDEIDARTRKQIQERYLKKSFEEVFDEVRQRYPSSDIERAGRSPKVRMALVFKRYFQYSTRWALAGDRENKVDFQVHCGPALGAFNQWVRGTPIEPWRARHVDHLAEHLMECTASLLAARLSAFRGPQDRG